MRLLTIVTGLLFAGVAFWAMAGSNDEAAKEMAKVAGAWKVEVIQEDGKSPPAEVVQSMTLIIKGETWSFLVGEKQEAAGTFTMDPEKKTIDRVDLEGKDKGKEFHGIYEVDGDTFKACWGPAGKERPTKFESKEGTGCEYDVLKRKK